MIVPGYARETAEVAVLLLAAALAAAVVLAAVVTRRATPAWSGPSRRVRRP